MFIHKSSWNLVFFFSSRRRHTRFDCDWSSDVCSSDLSFSRSMLPMASTKAGEGWPRLSRIVEAASRCPASQRLNASSSCASRRRRSASLRSEEHTSELQSQSKLVCRLLLEKNKQSQTS